MLADDIEALNYDSPEAVAQLTRSDRYKTIMAAVRQAEADDVAGTATAWAARVRRIRFTSAAMPVDRVVRCLRNWGRPAGPRVAVHAWLGSEGLVAL
jgi:hypothetical protein